MKQMNIAYVAVCCDDEKFNEIEQLGLEVELEDNDYILIRAAEVDIDANILRKLSSQYGPLNEIAIDAGNEADEICKNLAEIGCELSEPYTETDEHYIGHAGWTKEVCFEATVYDVDIEKIIEVLF